MYWNSTYLGGVTMTTVFAFLRNKLSIALHLELGVLMSPF